MSVHVRGLPCLFTVQCWNCIKCFVPYLHYTCSKGEARHINKTLMGAELECAQALYRAITPDGEELRKQFVVVKLIDLFCIKSQEKRSVQRETEATLQAALRASEWDRHTKGENK